MSRREATGLRIPSAVIKPGREPSAGIFPRIREISDSFGTTIRVSVEPDPTGALVVIDRLDRKEQPKVVLDSYGADILLGFIMSVRLAVPGEMTLEEIDGRFPTRFGLECGREPAILVDQLHSDGPFRIPASLWDRTYADLIIVCAHAREMVRRKETRIH